MNHNNSIFSKDFLDHYTKWLRDNMSTHTLDNGVVELTIPFLDSSNDYIQIYIIQNNDDSYTLTDDGHTIFDLELNSVSTNSPKQKDMLLNICNNHEIELSNNALTIKTQNSTLPQSINRLVQAILAISEISILGQDL